MSERTVTATTRKRCLFCNRMVEIGESAVLTDDRYQFSRSSYFGRSYPRGAWHLWHPECREGLLKRAAELEAERQIENARELAEWRAEVEAVKA